MKKPKQKPEKTELQKYSMYIIGCFLFAIFAYIVVMSINSAYNLEDDNKIEENIECIVENVTGLDIDLTPMTPEETK